MTLFFGDTYQERLFKYTVQSNLQSPVFVRCWVRYTAWSKS